MSKELAKKIAVIMTKVKYIQKRGRNNFHKYNYATEADVNDAVREHMAELNIIMIPSVKETTIRETKTRSGNTEYIARVDMDFTFIDGDSGDSITLSMSGEGQDVGDKAIYKAISGTQKYAIMKLFMIPTGDDPELDDTDRRIHEQPSQQNNRQPARQPQPEVDDNRPVDGLDGHVVEIKVEPPSQKAKALWSFKKGSLTGLGEHIEKQMKLGYSMKNIEANLANEIRVPDSIGDLWAGMYIDNADTMKKLNPWFIQKIVEGMTVEQIESQLAEAMTKKQTAAAGA